MKLSDKQYMLHRSVNYEINSELLIDVVKYYYGDGMKMYRSFSGDSIVLFDETDIGTNDFKSLYIPWKNPTISPLELDALLGMNKL